MEETVVVEVVWDAEQGDGRPPDTAQEVPLSVHAKDSVHEDAVAEYLTEKTGWLVKDWRLT